MHIIALSTNLFAIFNFVKKNTRIHLLLLELMIFLELHRIFYFRVEKCFRRKNFTSNFFYSKDFSVFFIGAPAKNFLERNEYRLNSFRIFRMETGKRSASDSFGRRYTNKVTISCRRWI